MKAYVLASRKKKTFVVLNPVAGQSKRNVVQKKIRSVFTNAQIPYHIHETTKSEDLHALVKSAIIRDYKQLVAIGGDGTVSGVASGLVNTQIPVVIIPTGTSNALAKVLQIPLTTDRIFDWWLNTDQVKKIDAMQVGDRYYFLNISTGVSSQALTDVKRQDKRVLGSIAYWLRGLQRLVGISPNQFCFDIDDQVFKAQASELIVANSGIIQFQPLRLNPEIEMDDGKLSVCYIRANTILDYLQILVGMLSGNPAKKPSLDCQDTYRKVKIHTDQPLPIQADGELIGSTPVDVKVVPAAARILIPNQD